VDFSVLFVPSTLHGSPEQYGELFEQVRAAERLGYDGVWFTEHHFSEYGRPEPTMLAAHAAGITERVRIGVAVVVLPLHNPVTVAEQVATLDHLCEGRFQFGMGRGNQPDEFQGYGVSLDESKQRFDEAFTIMTGLWTSERFSYEGEFWQVAEVTLVPRLRGDSPPPLWQPAVSPPSVRWVISKSINGLIGPYLTPFEVLQTKYFEPWHQAVAEAGGPPVKLGHNQFVHVAETDKQAYQEAEEAAIWYARMASRLWGERDKAKVSPQFAYMVEVLEFFERVTFDEIYEMSLIGSPQRVAEQVERLRGFGVDELLVFNWFGPQLGHNRIMRSLELFAENVIPEFKELGVRTGIAS
jgi:alkanesulfonate monooxygenase SsuD/methylene tetrahydromethanopterin reductase-like flavin-dependent oxidoreductase (luciferase family)